MLTGLFDIIYIYYILIMDNILQVVLNNSVLNNPV